MSQRAAITQLTAIRGRYGNLPHAAAKGSHVDYDSYCGAAPRRINLGRVVAAAEIDGGSSEVVVVAAGADWGDETARAVTTVLSRQVGG